VFSGNGFVPLSGLSNFNFTKGSRGIVRRNGETTFTLEAKVDDPLQMIAVTERAYAALSHMELPRGFSWDRSESAFRRSQDEIKELLNAFVLALFLVFLLMAILFESLLLPISVLFTIPFAIMGAWWALFFTGVSMDSFGYIGMIILAGVVVNNGIVLIDRIHNLSAVMSRSEAVILGCGQRVRPVLMTALTTVCGLAPMIVSEPPSGTVVDYRALATIVAGGLIASTFFTLWIVPLAYTVLDDLGKIMGDRVRWWLRKPGGGKGELFPEGTASFPVMRR
jgi:multidrug efflux pump subunit AcrB